MIRNTGAKHQNAGPRLEDIQRSGRGPKHGQRIPAANKGVIRIVGNEEDLGEDIRFYSSESGNKTNPRCEVPSTLIFKGFLRRMCRVYFRLSLTGCASSHSQLTY